MCIIHRVMLELFRYLHYCTECKCSNPGKSGYVGSNGSGLPKVRPLTKITRNINSYHKRAIPVRKYSE